MGKTSKLNQPITAFFIVYLLSLAKKLFDTVFYSDFYREMHSNWLINYSGGFIRRGLGGEIILRLSSFSGVSSATLINIIAASVWIVLILFFILEFKKKKYSFFILAMPFFLGNTILIDPSLFLRKDSFCLLIFIAMLDIFYKKNLKPFILFFIINLLFILGILVHEVIFFFSSPILFLSYWQKRKSFWKSLLFFLPSITVFMLSYALSNKAVALEMIRLTPEITPDFVGFLFTPFFRNFAVLWSCANDPNIFFTIFYLAVWVLAVYFSCVNFGKIKLIETDVVEINTNFLSQILIFQLVSILPLFFCTWDWGRWIYLWTSSSFAYFLLADESPFNEKIMSKLDLSRKEWFVRVSSRPMLVFCIAVLINCQYMIPMEVEFFIRTPVFSALNLLSEIILKVISL